MVPLYLALVHKLGVRTGTDETAVQNFKRRFLTAFQLAFEGLVLSIMTMEVDLEHEKLVELQLRHRKRLICVAKCVACALVSKVLPRKAISPVIVTLWDSYTNDKVDPRLRSFLADSITEFLLCFDFSRTDELSTFVLKIKEYVEDSSNAVNKREQLVFRDLFDKLGSDSRSPDDTSIRVLYSVMEDLKEC